MLAAIIAFSFTLIVTMVAGIPLAARLAQAHVWKRTALPDMPGDRDQHERALFVPVDFGPDLVKWPSEIERESHAVPEPAWPSAGWEDAHFGQYGSYTTHQSPRNPDEPFRAERNGPVSEAPVAKQKTKPQKTKPQKTKQKAAPDRPAPQSAPQQSMPSSGSANANLPDPVTLERMVDELGLAGTVQHLMKTQGWDFKTAAGWLGRARKG